jgi:hypothetical protein
VAGQRWDLIVTMDHATNEHYAMEFVEEEGTHSSFSGVAAVIGADGLFSADILGIFHVPDAWPAISRTGSSSRRTRNVPRRIRSRHHAGSGSAGFALPPEPATR